MFYNSKSKIFIIICVFALSLSCTKKAKDTKTIKFGYVNWPGVTIKTHVVRKIAEYLGYKTEMISGSQQVIFKSMETKQVDVFLGNWLPTMSENFKPYEKSGMVKNVKANLSECLFKTAVNIQAWDSGVRSFEDLNKHGEKFDKTIYGIEPGNDGNMIIKKAIKDNTYNLKDWELVPGDTDSMLDAVQRRISKNKWVAFNAWKPHYMNIVFKIKYLSDPKGIWGGNDTVYTVIRSGYEKESPNFYKFLKNFEVNAQIQSQWIYEYKKKNIDPEKVAEQWISKNPAIVQKWLEGVKSLDGRNAMNVIK